MPMDRSRYAENWEEISFKVRNEAGWHCEHCHKPCLRPGESIADLALRVEDRWLEHLIQGDREIHKFRFVLTVAHLDQNPANNNRANLRALCAPCHLKYDRPHLEANRKRKTERAGQLRLKLFPA